MRILVILIGVVAIALSLIPFGFGMLGLLGALADASLEENRRFGLTLISYAVPMALIGAIFCVAGLFAFRRDLKTKD